MRKHGWMALTLAGITTACAAGGGRSPVDYTMVAADAEGATPAQLAQQVQAASADFALIVAAQDAAWFTELAGATQLSLSGPAVSSDDVGLAFLSRLELLGDTSIVLGTGAAQVQVQDALYQVADERFLDLMLMRMPAGVDVPAAARALLEYMATDVMANASVVLGVTAASAQDADRMENLLRAAFANASECGGLPADGMTYRTFFGPPARTRCEEARQLDDPARGVVARISVGLQ
jgi:hypothetical protein